MSTSLAELDQLEQRLAEIRSPRDAKAATKWADVMAELARSLGLSLEQQNQIAEYRLRAQRRGGQLLPESGIGKGIKSFTLKDFDIDAMESHRWQAIASLPDDVFEGYINNMLEAGAELTTAGLLRLKLSKPVPDPGSGEVGTPLLRFCQELPTGTIVTLILRVAFPDAETALDVTYGSGAFWDGSAHVRVTAHDARPERAPHGVADFTRLPYQDEAFDVVLFDPPHIADAGQDSIMGQRFGTFDYADMEARIGAGTLEAWRVARLGIVVKVTDHVHAQAFVSESDWVRTALGGQIPYDLVHQVRSGALIDPKWEEQQHAYNNGSSYLIFRKFT